MGDGTVADNGNTATNTSAAKESASFKSGCKPRRSGVRLEGHIDHILRRRIVLRERELIPKGLRTDLLDDFSLGNAYPPPEKWDVSRSYHQVGSTLQNLRTDTAEPRALNGSTISSTHTNFDGPDHCVGAGMNDLWSCVSPQSSAPCAEGGGAGALTGSSRAMWHGSRVLAEKESLLDMLRSPNLAPGSPGQGSQSGFGACEASGNYYSHERVDRPLLTLQCGAYDTAPGFAGAAGAADAVLSLLNSESLLRGSTSPLHRHTQQQTSQQKLAALLLTSCPNLSQALLQRSFSSGPAGNTFRHDSQVNSRASIEQCALMALLGSKPQDETMRNSCNTLQGTERERGAEEDKSLRRKQACHGWGGARSKTSTIPERERERALERERERQRDSPSKSMVSKKRCHSDVDTISEPSGSLSACGGAYTCASPNKLSENGPGEGADGEAAYASGMDLLLLATLAEQAETKRDLEGAEWRRDCV